jgi:hypothetical protein
MSHNTQSCNHQLRYRSHPEYFVSGPAQTRDLESEILSMYRYGPLQGTTELPLIQVYSYIYMYPCLQRNKKDIDYDQG